MRDCPGKPSTTRTAEGPHSSGAAVVSSSGSGRPARAHIRTNAASNAATAGPHTASIVSRQGARPAARLRSEEHTPELQSRQDLVCRLLLVNKRYHTIYR